MKSGSATLKSTLYNNSRVVVADLIRFVFPTTTARFTNAPLDLTIGGLLYSSAHISGIELLQGMGVEVETLALGMAVSNQTIAGQDYLSAAISGVFDGIRVQVFRAISVTGNFAGYLEADLLPIFDGTCEEITPTSKSAITFRIKSVLAKADVPVSNRMTSAQCPRVLGAIDCGVNLASFTHARTVAASSALSITLNTASTFAVVGSVVTLTSGTYAGQSRNVASVAGAVVTLDAPFSGLPAVGDGINVIRACDKAYETCRSPFLNQINYGGCPRAPIDNK